MRAPDRPGRTAVEAVGFARILVLFSSDKSGEVVAAAAAGEETGRMYTAGSPATRAARQRPGDHRRGSRPPTPSAAELDSEGRVKLCDGKRDYKPVITFETADARERWQRVVVAALSDAGIA